MCRSTNEITHRGTVYPWQCDHMGHMNVMWYTGRFDEASWQFLAQNGLYRSVGTADGLALAAVQQNITYERELRAGDTVSIRSRFIEIREKVLRFVHEMTNDQTGERVAVSELTAVQMDPETRRSTPFPVGFRKRVESILSAHSLTESRPGEFVGMRLAPRL